MAFQRRLYYSLETGQVIICDMKNGSFEPHDQAWDFEHDQQLKPYADHQELVGVFEWAEPDPELEQEFATSYGVSVDVSTMPHKLVFDHTPPEPEPQPDPAAQEILDIIKGVQP